MSPPENPSGHVAYWLAEPDHTLQKYTPLDTLLVNVYDAGNHSALRTLLLRPRKNLSEGATLSPSEVPPSRTEREAQHTLGHVDCEACHDAALDKMSTSDMAKLPFGAAAGLWLDSRKNIDEATRNNYRCYFKALANFFGKLTIAEITIGHIQTYQEQRKRGEVPGLCRKAGHSVIDHELNALQQVMVRAGEWARLADWYEPLPLPKPTVGCALTEAEEARLLRVASSRRRWLVAYCCTLLTVNTTAGAGEIRRMRLQDVDLAKRTIYIREGAKNETRVRTIPLNDDALWAARELLARAAEMGAIFPHHYLLPHRADAKGGKADPNRPMGGWRSAWESLRKAAGLPHLRRHDLRHHAITKLLENPNISERTVQDLAGHVSQRMQDLYSHTRRKALDEAVEAVSTNVTAPKKPILMARSEPKPPQPKAAADLPLFFSSATTYRK